MKFSFKMTFFEIWYTDPLTLFTSLGTSELQLERIEVYYNEAMGLSPESKARGEKLVSGGKFVPR
jgi:hypothetical protein